MIDIAKKGLGIIRNIIFVFALFILVSYGIMIFLNVRPAVVVSGSMEPTIKTGSLVLVDRNSRDVDERNIVAFKSGDTLVIHRIEKVTVDGYVTKGDANDSADPALLKRENLEGRVVMWIPYAGYAVKFMTSLPVIIVCMMLILVTLLLQVAWGKEQR